MTIRQLIKKIKKDTMITLYVNGHYQGSVFVQRFEKVFNKYLDERTFEISIDTEDYGILINVIMEG